MWFLVVEKTCGSMCCTLSFLFLFCKTKVVAWLLRIVLILRMSNTTLRINWAIFLWCVYNTNSPRTACNHVPCCIDTLGHGQIIVHYIQLLSFKWLCVPDMVIVIWSRVLWQLRLWGYWDFTFMFLGLDVECTLWVTFIHCIYYII